uniref:Uncharacterized protein n=1 Tax=Rhizophora mucronata TaxID=61149 RepID=A0A2P2QZJ0_RHIMU
MFNQNLKPYQQRVCLIKSTKSR